MTGTVVDSETNRPLDGAVVLVEWTITTGKAIGFRATDSYKVVETVTDNDGRFAVSTVLNPFVDSPHLTIYKKGYVAWNSNYIFPDYEKRTDFVWQKNHIFQMKKFNHEFSFIKHVSFIRSAIHSEVASEKKSILKNTIEWEVNNSLRELETKK
jgi:hypothetical protein